MQKPSESEGLSVRGFCLSGHLDLCGPFLFVGLARCWSSPYPCQTHGQGEAPFLTMLLMLGHGHKVVMWIKPLFPRLFYCVSPAFSKPEPEVGFQFTPSPGSMGREMVPTPNYDSLSQFLFLRGFWVRSPQVLKKKKNLFPVVVLIIVLGSIYEWI